MDNSINTKGPKKYELNFSTKESLETFQVKVCIEIELNVQSADFDFSIFALMNKLHKFQM